MRKQQEANEEYYYYEEDEDSSGDRIEYYDEDEEVQCRLCDGEEALLGEVLVRLVVAVLLK